MAEVMRVLANRTERIGEIEREIELTDEGIQSFLSDALPEEGSLFFKDGCKVFIDGQNEPEKIVEIARAWNQEIQDTAQAAVQKWAEKGFPLDSDESFRARKAIEAADNKFNLDGLNFKAVVVSNDDGWSLYFGVLIPGDMAEEIEACPQEFVLLDAVYDF